MTCRSPRFTIPLRSGGDTVSRQTLKFSSDEGSAPVRYHETGTNSAAPRWNSARSSADKYIDSIRKRSPSPGRSQLKSDALWFTTTFSSSIRRPASAAHSVWGVACAIDGITRSPDLT